jgi:hypothetical protein
MKPIRSRHKHGRHPEEVTRSLLRVTVSKDGRRKRRRWPSFEAAAVAREVLNRFPDLNLKHRPFSLYRNSQNADHIRESLREAGLNEQS